MGYLDELPAYVSKEAPDELPTKPTKLGSVSFVSAPRKHFRDPARMFNRWVRSMNALDACQPVGRPMGRWQTLFDCSVWWLENFGLQAARDGWGTDNVFGLYPGVPRAGGLIDRLGESRSLVMAEGCTRWRSWSVADYLHSGACPNLLPWWEGAE